MTEVIKPKRSRDLIPLDQDVYTLAVERCKHVFRTFDQVCVMFSGGKDSTATLMVALAALHESPELAHHLPLRAVFYDEEAIPFETEEYVRRIGQRDDVALEWYCVPQQHRNACARKSPWWWPWAPESRDLWCRPLPPEALTVFPGMVTEPPEARPTAPEMNTLIFDPAKGNGAILMGIRAQESLTRRRAVTVVRKEGGENWLVAQGGVIWKAYPVYDWTARDVWTAPAQLHWDYNRAYDRLEMAGISITLQRCSPAFGEEPLQKIHTYAACFPEVWDKMIDRVPGVGSAARYALTELYSYHGRPDKPEGMPWGDFLIHYLGKYEPKERHLIASRLKREIQFHYRKTVLPIVPNTPHPETGISWGWLLMIAMRGDFKGRKQAGGRLSTANDGTKRCDPVFWHKYVRELEEIADAGTFGELSHPGKPPADPQALIPEYAREGVDTQEQPA